MTEVADLEIRWNAYRLLQAARAATAAEEEAEESYVEPPELLEKRQALIDEYEERRKATADWHEESMRALEKAGSSRVRDLVAASRAADKAYNDAEGPALMEDWEGNPMLCAKSKIPLWEDDETARDDETGEVWLRSALGLPPRAKAVEPKSEAA